MDIISHGLYGWAIFGNKNKKEFLLSAAFWVMPDFLAFGLPFAVGIISMLSWGNGWFSGPWGHTEPSYVHVIYKITHSLITWVIAFWVLRRINKKPLKASYARLLHILVDIPTHSLAFFATPFLWPISSYRFDGIPRSNKVIFIPNVILLVIIYTYYFYKKFKKTNKII